jgi:ribosomal protein S7
VESEKEAQSVHLVNTSQLSQIDKPMEALIQVLLKSGKRKHSQQVNYDSFCLVSELSSEEITKIN